MWCDKLNHCIETTFNSLNDLFKYHQHISRPPCVHFWELKVYRDPSVLKVEENIQDGNCVSILNNKVVVCFHDNKLQWRLVLDSVPAVVHSLQQSNVTKSCRRCSLCTDFDTKWLRQQPQLEVFLSDWEKEREGKSVYLHDWTTVDSTW